MNDLTLRIASAILTYCAIRKRLMERLRRMAIILGPAFQCCRRPAQQGRPATLYRSNIADWWTNQGF